MENNSRECAICGRLFDLTRRNKIYCSKECKSLRDKNWYKNKHIKTYVPKYYSEKACVVCNKSFTPIRCDQEACSTCSRMLSNHKRKKQRAFDISCMKYYECKGCGKNFAIKRTNGRRQMFCSRRCRISYYNFNYYKQKKPYCKKTGNPTIRLFKNEKRNPCIYKTQAERDAARIRQQKLWYIKNYELSKARAAEYYKKPERKEQMQLYKIFGKAAKPPTVCKKIIAILHSIKRGTIAATLKPISEGRTYEAYL